MDSSDADGEHVHATALGQPRRGDGAVSYDSTSWRRSARSLDLLSRRRRTPRRLRVTDHRGEVTSTGTRALPTSPGLSTASATISRRSPTITAPSADDDLEGGRHDRLLGQRVRSRRRGRCPARALSLGAPHPALPVELPHAHDSDLVRESRAGSFAAPDHEYPSYLELRADGDRRAAARTDDDVGDASIRRPSHSTSRPRRPASSSPVSGVVERTHAVHPDGHPRLHQH